MQLDRIQIIKKLLEQKLVSRETIYRALILSRSNGIESLKLVARFAGMTSGQIRAFCQSHLGIPTIDLRALVLNPAVVRSIPYELAMEHRLIPAFKVRGCTHLAVSDPFDLEGMEAAFQYTGQNSRVFLAQEDQVEHAIYDFKNRSAPPAPRESYQDRKVIDACLS